MNNEKLTPTQQVFINEMINGASQKQAYLAAYPGSSTEAAYSSASRLMDKPHIRQLVNEGLEELSYMKNVLVLRHKAQRLTDITDQRRSLAPLITGEWANTRVTMVKGKMTVHHCPPDPRLCLSAVRLDAQLSKEYEKIVTQMQNKDILKQLLEGTGTAPKPRVSFPQPQVGENAVVEKEQNFLAGLSNSYEKTLEDCGKSHQNPAVFPSNADEKTSDNCGKDYRGNAAGLSMTDLTDNTTCGNSYEKTLEDCGNSCEILANSSTVDGKENEVLENLLDKIDAEVNEVSRHLNRKQRREMERRLQKAKAAEARKNLVNC